MKGKCVFVIVFISHISNVVGTDGTGTLFWKQHCINKSDQNQATVKNIMEDVLKNTQEMAKKFDDIEVVYLEVDIEASRGHENELFETEIFINVNDCSRYDEINANMTNDAFHWAGVRNFMMRMPTKSGLPDGTITDEEVDGEDLVLSRTYRPSFKPIHCFNKTRERLDELIAIRNSVRKLMADLQGKYKELAIVKIQLDIEALNLKDPEVSYTTVVMNVNDCSEYHTNYTWWSSPSNMTSANDTADTGLGKGDNNHVNNNAGGHDGSENSKNNSTSVDAADKEDKNNSTGTKSDADGKEEGDSNHSNNNAGGHDGSENSKYNGTSVDAADKEDKNNSTGIKGDADGKEEGDSNHANNNAGGHDGSESSKNNSTSVDAADKEDKNNSTGIKSDADGKEENSTINESNGKQNKKYTNGLEDNNSLVDKDGHVTGNIEDTSIGNGTDDPPKHEANGEQHPEKNNSSENDCKDTDENDSKNTVENVSKNTDENVSKNTDENVSKNTDENDSKNTDDNNDKSRDKSEIDSGSINEDDNVYKGKSTKPDSKKNLFGVSTLGYIESNKNQEDDADYTDYTSSSADIETNYEHKEEKIKPIGKTKLLSGSTVGIIENHESKVIDEQIYGEYYDSNEYKDRPAVKKPVDYIGPGYEFGKSKYLELEGNDLSVYNNEVLDDKSEDYTNSKSNLQNGNVKRLTKLSYKLKSKVKNNEHNKEKIKYLGYAQVIKQRKNKKPRKHYKKKLENERNKFLLNPNKVKVIF